MSIYKEINGGAFAAIYLFPYIYVWAVWWSICRLGFISLYIDMYGPYGGAFAAIYLFPYILTYMVEHLQTLVYFLIY